MSGNGSGYRGSGSSVARTVTPPTPPSSDGKFFATSARNPIRGHHVDPPRIYYDSQNVVGNDSNFAGTMPLGRDLHTSGIFRVPSANAGRPAGSASPRATSTTTRPRDANDEDDDDAMYAFLKMPALSHDTDNNTDDDDDDDDDDATFGDGEGIVDVVYY